MEPRDDGTAHVERLLIGAAGFEPARPAPEGLEQRALDRMAQPGAPPHRRRHSAPSAALVAGGLAVGATVLLCAAHLPRSRPVPQGVPIAFALPAAPTPADPPAPVAAATAALEERSRAPVALAFRAAPPAGIARPLPRAARRVGRPRASRRPGPAVAQWSVQVVERRVGGVLAPGFVLERDGATGEWIASPGLLGVHREIGIVPAGEVAPAGGEGGALFLAAPGEGGER
jgi:hypothetical protein